MSNGKDDVIRNPNRVANPKVEKYVPEYVKRNVTPIAVPASKIPLEAQKLAPVVENDFSVDGDVYDDFGDAMKLPTGQVIDNNEFIDLGPYNPMPSQNQETNSSEPKSQYTQGTISSSPQVGDYILMVFGKILTSGSLVDIESRVKSIVYGDDEEYGNKTVSVDDIVVLKRLNIKIGVFVEE